MKWRWALPLAAVVFIYALLMRAPAANLFAWFVPHNSPVQIDGVDGTLKHGTLSAIAVNGHPIMKNLQWRLHPLWLLLGRVALDVQGGAATTTSLNGSLQLSPGALRAGPLKLASDLKSILSQAGYAFLPVDGQAQLEVQHLQLEGNHLSDLQGHLTLQGLRWNLGQQPLQLGDFAADASTDAHGTVNATINSVSGPLDVSGKASLDADVNYQLDLRIKAKPGAPPMLVNMLQEMGRPGAGGYHEIHDKGRLSVALPGAR